MGRAAQAVEKTGAPSTNAPVPSEATSAPWRKASRSQAIVSAVSSDWMERHGSTKPGTHTSSGAGSHSQSGVVAAERPWSSETDLPVEAKARSQGARPSKGTPFPKTWITLARSCVHMPSMRRATTRGTRDVLLFDMHIVLHMGSTLSYSPHDARHDAHVFLAHAALPAGKSHADGDGTAWYARQTARLTAEPKGLLCKRRVQHTRTSLGETKGRPPCLSIVAPDAIRTFTLAWTATPRPLLPANRWGTTHSSGMRPHTGRAPVAPGMRREEKSDSG